jgi:hypothetical protein
MIEAPKAPRNPCFFASFRQAANKTAQEDAKVKRDALIALFSLKAL